MFDFVRAANTAKSSDLWILLGAVIWSAPSIAFVARQDIDSFVSWGTVGAIALVVSMQLSSDARRAEVDLNRDAAFSIVEMFLVHGSTIERASQMHGDPEQRAAISAARSSMLETIKQHGKRVRYLEHRISIRIWVGIALTAIASLQSVFGSELVSWIGSGA